MKLQRDVIAIAVLLVGAISFVGCRSSQYVRDPEFADVDYAAHQAWTEPDLSAQAISPVVGELSGPHRVEEYISYALQQNPDIQAARKRIEAYAYRVPVAASLQDPMLGVTLFAEEVQTAAGEQEFLMTASQKVPWFGKLETRADVAEQETQVARAQLAAVELATIDKVKRAYYELYFIQEAIKITEVLKELLIQLRGVANTQFQAKKVTQQDVLRADVEVSNIENQLIRLRQQLESAQARLGRVLHINPQTKLRAVENLPEEQIPNDLDRLHRQAIAARPELHAQLAAIQRDRRSADLARLEYYPDVTFGMTWINVSDTGISPVSNGRDAVLLGASVNLPIFRKRLDSAILAAEAKMVSSARQYDSLKDDTLEQVMDLFAQVQSQQKLLEVFSKDIIPKARQTLTVSSRGYSAGDVDFLQLIDNWRSLLQYQITYKRIEAQLRQSLSALERIVGGYLEPSRQLEPVPPPENGEQPPEN